MSSRDEVRLAYDAASEAYARHFLRELDHKPMDRALLHRFADELGPGRVVLDLGCGPGHTTAFLHSLGVDAVGVDLSPRMVECASKEFPGLDFEQGDFLSLDRDSGSVGGILAFYCIVHLTREQLAPAFAEMLRVLEPGGTLLLSFHVGTDVVHNEDFLGSSMPLDFTTFLVPEVEEALTKVGFGDLDVTTRSPYETEYPSERSYVFAYKPRSAARH